MSQTGLKHSVGARMAIVGFLTFLLLIPSFMIMSLISEREARRDAAADEISRNWGAKQVLIGPVLEIPFKIHTYDSQNNLIESTGYAHFLPDTLKIDGAIDTETRNRGIYEVVVYNSTLDISAAFSAPKFEELKVSPDDILWNDATISLGISDLKGVRDQVTMQWNNEGFDGNPGLASNDIVSTGLSVPAKVSADKSEYAFKSKLNLNGSLGILFSPVGKVTSVHMTSDWKNPSFTGDYLPTVRDVSESGFESDWKVLHVSRGFPQEWTGTRYKVDQTLFGVTLPLSVDHYQKATRTVKYAIMFMALTFMTFFVLEVLSGKPIHPIQYLFIGLALMVFYTLLLSLSEYVAFGYAYSIASAGVVVLITGYARSLLSDRTRSAIVAVVLSLLYGYLYIILQLQDYALLMGSLILFVALALLMYLTRKIDWFSVMNPRKTDT
jgi:inner membrane protein